MMKFIFYILFFVFINFSLTSIPGIQSYNTGLNASSTLLGNYTLLALALTINTLIAIFAYFAYKIFNNEGLKMYAANEFSNLFITIFIISAFFLVTTQFSTILSNALYHSTVVTNPGISTFAVDNSVFDYYFDVSFALLYSITHYTTRVSNKMASVAVVFTSVASNSYSVTGSPDLSGESAANISGFILNSLKNIFILNSLYYLLFDIMLFFRSSALTIFLPIGILLRIFPISRGAGAFLMAIAISFQFIFPFSFILFFNYIDFQEKESISGISEIITQVDELDNISPCPGFSVFNVQVEDNLREYILKDITGFVGSISSFLSFTLLKITTTIFVSAIFTYTSVHSLSGIFGADIPEIGRGFFRVI